MTIVRKYIEFLRFKIGKTWKKQFESFGDRRDRIYREPSRGSASATRGPGPMPFEKKDWFEMGGAGVFRPEVTMPLGCTDTVLAWGLGMERLAMFIYELSDIREIYMSDIKWLESVSMNQSLKI